jgi:hypothetical protein
MNTVVLWVLMGTNFAGGVEVIARDIPSKGDCDAAKRAYVTALRQERHPAPERATLTCSPIKTASMPR